MGIALALLAAFALSLGVNFLLARRKVPQLEILAQVNGRSAHTVPVPIGGGIGILFGMILGLILLPELVSYIIIPLLICSLALAALSWWNDKHDIRASYRLGAQALAAICCLALLPVVSWWLLLLLFFGLLWFTNLYNFMDGSDGIMAVETITIALGLALFMHSLLPLCLVAATLAFLYFNFPPARLFSGDVGSIPLGFFLGFMLILLALNIGFVTALILPLYFVMDASITLIKRLVARENIFEAHSQHYFQQAIKKGFSHKRVMLTVAGLNLFLLACAYLSLTQPIIAMALAVLAVSLCLWHFRKP